ncbi:MAG: lytic transglycosylase domain-containing protein [Bdellovibrionales bacterium]|nr:lytic transglycosylase domain-containing protein [Bdellovibrionales bacterium]
MPKFVHKNECFCQKFLQLYLICSSYQTDTSFAGTAFALNNNMILILKLYFIAITALALPMESGWLHSNGSKNALDKFSKVSLSPLRVNYLQSFDRSSVLDDPYNRVEKEFQAPEILKKRVGFWFDIYTQHDSKTYVIHHTKYPWVVFDVIKTHNFYKGNAATWYKRKKAKAYVKKRRKQISRTLLTLSKRSHFKNLKGLEAQVYNALNSLNGSRKYLLRNSRRYLRTQLGQKDFIEKGIKTSTLYMPHIENIFKNSGLPISLTRMPFVESSFNIDAYSKVGASGIWQIMPRSGRELLTVNSKIDERNNPIKASEYAAHHLKRDYRILKSWPLAVTAYNHGVGSMRRAVRKVGTRDYVKIHARYKDRSFRFASRNFYSCFLAINYAYEYRKEIYKVKPLADSFEYQTVKLPFALKKASILETSGMSRDDFIHYNYDLKELKTSYKLPKGFKILLPPENRKLLSSQLLTLAKAKKLSKGQISKLEKALNKDAS